MDDITEYDTPVVVIFNVYTFPTLVEVQPILGVIVNVDTGIDGVTIALLCKLINQLILLNIDNVVKKKYYKIINILYHYSFNMI